MEVDTAPVEPMASTSSLSLQDASGDATMTDAQPTTLTANAEGVQEGAEGTNVEVDKEKEPEPLKPGEEPDASGELSVRFWCDEFGGALYFSGFLKLRKYGVYGPCVQQPRDDGEG